MTAPPFGFDCGQIFSDDDAKVQDVSWFDFNVAQSSPPSPPPSFDVDVFESGSDDDAKFKDMSYEFLFDANVAQSMPAPSHAKFQDVSCFDVSVAQSSPASPASPPLRLTAGPHVDVGASTHTVTRGQGGGQRVHGGGCSCSGSGDVTNASIESVGARFRLR